MKRSICILLALVMAILLAGCGTKISNESPNESPSYDVSANDSVASSNDTKSDEESSITVDKNLITVDVTLPASMVGNMTEEEIEATVEENGYEKYVLNSDGSVTYTMTKSRHSELLEELKSSLDEAINDYISGENKVASFVNITYNNDLSEFNIYVDAEQFGILDGFYAMAFYVTGAYYQVFNGANAEDVDSVVNFVDNETQEIIDSISYKSTIESINESLNENTNNVEADNTAPIINLNMNETVTIGDMMELTFESAEWVEEINPSNTSGFYSHYDDKDGEKYFVIRGKVKNLTGDDLDIYYMQDSEILINGKYKANISMESESSDGNSFYGTIKPLQTLQIIAYASVSDELFDICEEIVFTMNVLNDSAYINNFYSDMRPHETYQMTLN